VTVSHFVYVLYSGLYYMKIYKQSNFCFFVALALVCLPGYANDEAEYTMGSSGFYGSDGLKYCRYHLVVEGVDWGWFNAIVTRSGGSYSCRTQNHGDYKFSNYTFMWGNRTY